MTSTDLSTLSLFLATPEQVIESYRRTTKEWGRGQSEEQYVRHNQFQAETFEVARDRKWLVWVLAPRDDPETLDFKCSCETYRRPGLALAPKTSVPQDVFCYGIASVFTPSANRGKGYARHMMRLLHWVLSSPGSLSASSFPSDQWGPPPPRVESPIAGDGRFSALWSDVGPFYEGCGPFGKDQDGWKVKDPKSTIWDVPSISEDAFSLENGTWEWLYEETTQTLWDEDVRNMRAEMASLGPDSEDVFFTFLPSGGLEDYQRIKLKFRWEREGIVQWGVRVDPSIVDPDTRNGPPDFATWTVTLSGPEPRTLLITRLRAHKHTFPIILAGAVQVAKKHGLEKIEVWNLGEDLQVAGVPGKTFTRDEHLPAVEWYGEERESAKNIVWLNNEKFCWC